MVDLEAGVTLTFNGEIYNYRELREALRSRGVEFHSIGDTEVLLRAYIAWGKDFLDEVQGMFAFALFDKRRRQLVLARDRAGQKPLYYWLDGNELVFASEIKALLTLKRCGRQVDKDALNEYLTYGYTLGPKTLAKGISKVLPGERLTYDIDSGRLTKGFYWRLPYPAGCPAPLEAIDQELEAHLVRAVERHLVADVPLGIMLSGGVDSSLLTALAATVSTERIRTFTAVFPGGGRFDEAAYARTVADYFGTEHTEIRVEESSPSILETLARQFDDPIADHAVVPMYLLSREIRAHATVALGGDGGDELFAGYPHYALALRHEALRRWIPRSVRNLVSVGASRLIPIGARGRNHLIGASGSVGNAIAHFNMYFDAYSRALLLGEPVSEAPEAKRAEFGKDMPDALRAAMVADFRTTLPEGYLAKLDRASMLASLEVRAPFLDDQLVQFAWRELPPSCKRTEFVSKAPLRRIARKLLPDSLDLNRKQGLTMPLADWFSGPWGTYLKEVIMDSEQDMFSRTFVEKLVRLQERGYANQNRIFSLAMFLLWRRTYGMSL
jgi:asparagine synthase (glutamine-hydrolysing)